MKRYDPVPEVRVLIVQIYTSGLSVKSTQLELRAQGHLVTEAGITRVLLDAGVMRNARQLKGARIKPVYRNKKQCEHCGEEFQQLFARHVFCDVCAPDGKFSKFIRKYGVSKREWDAMFEAQGGRCAICEKQLDCGQDTHIDHDHATKKVRGLLCNRCNTKVGILEDELFVAKMQAYLGKCSSLATCDMVDLT